MLEQFNDFYTFGLWGGKINASYASLLLGKGNRNQRGKEFKAWIALPPPDLEQGLALVGRKAG